MRLFTYKLTHDSGFAPNPFHEVLTLATCKPGIRQTKKEGDWIAGFCSIGLAKKAKRNGIAIDPDALIYIGKVSEVIPIEEYYNDKRFHNKIPPEKKTDDEIVCAGDNIYKQVSQNLDDGPPEFLQVSQIHHDKNDREHDTGGRNVLVFKEFYYLGRKGKPIPDYFDISRPRGPTRYGYRTDNEEKIMSFVGWVKSHFKAGLNDYPCLFGLSKENDDTCGYSGEHR